MLLRNKYYIVMYRGKDFVPTSVAAVLAERQELAKRVQDVEENVRCGPVGAVQSDEDDKQALPTGSAVALAQRQDLAKQSQVVEEKVQCEAVDVVQAGEDQEQALAGTLAEFYEAQARWGRDISAEEREKMIEEASKSKNARLVKRIEHKLAIVSLSLSLSLSLKIKCLKSISVILSLINPLATNDG